MPRRKQTAPKRMKYSEDGKEIEDDGDDENRDEDDEDNGADDSIQDDSEEKEDKVITNELNADTQDVDMTTESPRKTAASPIDNDIQNHSAAEKKYIPNMPKLFPPQSYDRVASPDEYSKPLPLLRKTDSPDQSVTSSKPSPNYKLSRTSSPCDYDQPLDLSFSGSSKKPKLDKKQSKYLNIDATDEKPLDLRVEEPCSSHSLLNLEKRFGSKSTILEGLGSKLQPPRNPVYQAFGGNLFTTALYNQPTSAPEQTAYRPNRNYWSTSVSSVLQQKPLPSNRTQFSSSTSQSSSSASKQNPGDTKVNPVNGSSGGTGGGKDEPVKHTTLVCGCRKQFETLYELTIHMQKTGHTPTSARSPEQGEYPKLVRGQDMWLNQGSEQTRQILRCMQCGESFKTLPELTIHMMKTRHYTNIVGAESKKVHKCSSYCDKCPESDSESVFKCKVCGQNFKDMEGLTNHLLISGHHRKRSRANSENELEEDLMFSKVHSGRSTPDSSPKQSPLPKLKKMIAATSPINVAKKSSQELKANKHSTPIKSETPKKNHPDSNRIRCESCGDKIDTPLFVEHVRVCVKIKTSPSETEKSKSKSTDEKSELKKMELATKRLKDDPILPKTVMPLKKSYSLRESYEHAKSPPPKGLKESSIPSSSPNKPIMHTTSTSPSSSSTSGSSALKAMESFIERSFTGGFSKPSFFGPKSSLSPASKFNQYMPKSGRQECPLPDSTQNLPAHQKYLNPHFAAELYKPKPPVEPKPSSQALPVKKEKPEIKSDPDEVEVPAKDAPPLSPKSEKDSDSDERPDSNTGDKNESPKPIHKKYLVEEDSANNETNNNSALESLQGLVYGKSFSSEHPLDSLQKLIHNTDGGPPNGSRPPNGSHQSVMTGTATFQHGGMPSTVILVNPIVTVVPNTSAPPAVHINIPVDSSPPAACQTSPSPGSVGSAKGGGSDKGADSDGEPGEYKCQACSRTFASKGSYRYHLSRCHLSTVRKYGFKEAFNMSPYVYLPLDHSAKFNKYYEMANELANKGNSVPSTPPESPTHEKTTVSVPTPPPPPPEEVLNAT